VTLHRLLPAPTSAAWVLTVLGVLALLWAKS